MPRPPAPMSSRSSRPLPGPQGGAHPGAPLDRRAAAGGARPGGQGGERAEAGARVAARASAPPASRPSELDRSLAEDRIDVDAPGRPAAPDRPPAPGVADPPRARGHLRRASASRCWRARRSSSSTTTSPRSTTRRSTRRGRRRTPSTSATTCSCGPTPRRCRCGRWSRKQPPIYVVVPGRVYRPDTPDATPRSDVPPARGAGRGRGHHARRPPGRPARVRARDVRTPTARSGCVPATSPSPSRAWRSTFPCFVCDGSGQPSAGERCPTLQGRGLDRDPRLGDGRPERLRVRARLRLRPRAGPGIRVRHGHRAHRRHQARRAGPAACCGRTTCGCWSSSAHEGPGRLAALRTATPAAPAEEIADVLTMAGRQARAAAPRRRRGPGDAFVVGQGARGRAAPRRRPADRLHGRRRRRRAAHDRLRRAQRGRRPDRGGGAARRDHARRHRAGRGQAPRRPVERDDPRRGRGRDRRGPRRDHGARPTAPSRARRSPSSCRSRTR